MKINHCGTLYTVRTRKSYYDREKGIDTSHKSQFISILPNDLPTANNAMDEEMS